jgi:predicted DNA-binding transcriptional regulator AlpA
MISMPHWSEFLDADAPDGAYLPWKKVESRVGISRTTAWRLQKTGDFPKPYVMSPGRVAYRESEVEAWKASRGHRNAQDLSGHRASPRATPLESSPAAPAPPDCSPTPSAKGAIAQTPLSSDPPRPPPSARPPVRPRRNGAGDDQMTFDF